MGHEITPSTLIKDLGTDLYTLMGTIWRKSFLKFGWHKTDKTIDGRFVYVFSIKPEPYDSEIYSHIIIDGNTSVEVFSVRILDFVYKAWEGILEKDPSEAKNVLNILRLLND